MSHYKNYGPTAERVPLFRDGGMTRGNVSVTANCSIGACQPPYRITVHLGDIASGSLTVSQSAALRAILERAEQDVLRGAEQDPPEVSCG